MKVTVVIPTMEKNKDYLKLCVESLRATVDWDIIVVSNGGNNYPLAGISGITIRGHNKDQGQCKAVNIGVKYASPDTDYIMVSNDDMYYAPGWNKKLDWDNVPLVFSPNLVEPVKPEGSAEPFLVMDGGFTLDEFNKEAVNDFMNGRLEVETEEPGFNLPFFIHKDVWDTIGGYDEEYDPWGSNSDTDFQTLINLAGVRPVRLRDVLVYHFSNKSGTFDGTHQAEWQHNFDYYTEKWGFNRDTVPGCDVWLNRNIIDYDKLLYMPKWMNRYGQA